MEQQTEIYDENGAIIQKRCYCLSSFHMYSTVATAVWDPDNISSEMEGCLLTPWNVLQCYLESILQVLHIVSIIFLVTYYSDCCALPMVKFKYCG